MKNIDPKNIRRKRLLFIARPFPPAPRVAAVRTYNVAKYLQLAGWDVEVVTLDAALHPQKGNNNALEQLRAIGVKVRHTANHWPFLAGGIHPSVKDRRPIYSKVAMKVADRVGIDDGIGWVRPALEACRDIEPGDVDVILATGSPFFSFQIAYILSNRLRCPYVLDYRDLWNMHSHSTHFWPQRFLERRWLKNASKLLFISRKCMEVMARWTGFGDKMCVITNGFDSEEFARIEGAPGERSVIVYAGNFFPPHRTPTPILEALQRLQNGPACPIFHYYGMANDLLAAAAERLGVTKSIVLHGMTERTAVLQAIKQANAAVVVTTVDRNGSLDDQGIVTGKLFEPLGLRTPVLLIAPYQNDARKIVEDTDCGRAFTGDDVDGIAAFLMRVCQGQERFSFAGVDRYSWRIIGGQLSETLKGVCQT